MSRRQWTPADDAALRRRYAGERTANIAADLGRSLASTYQRAQALDLHKSAAYLATEIAGRLRGQCGIASRFPKGHVPANKGLRRPGWGPGRMKATQFTKGERRGVAVKLWKPIGTERVSKDGYLERKVRDDNPDGLTREESNRRRQRRWVPVHRLVWEDAHGPVPQGHKVIFVNGDKRDVRLDNLALVTSATMMRRNSVHNLPKELASAVQLIGALTRQIRKRGRHGNEEQDSGLARSPVRDAGSVEGQGRADGHLAGEGGR